MSQGYRVEFREVTVGYRGHPVVENITFTTPGPGLTTILGPNGVGKSTLLKALIGSLRPWSGTITINGVSLSVEKDRSLYLSYAPPEPPNMFNMRAVEVVMTARKGKRWVSKQDAVESLRFVGAAELAMKYFEQLSTGQKRLVLLARALAVHSPIIVMDEPTANLDLGNQLRIRNIIRKAAGFSTVIAASHDVELAMDSDLVVAVKNGGILMRGPPSELTSKVVAELYDIDESELKSVAVTSMRYYQR